jgi:hypothetical protein
MKPHEKKTCTKQERKIREKQRAIKNKIKKGEKTIKAKSKKWKRGREKKLDKRK